MNNINIKEIVKTGIILFAVTAVAALLLACANMVTAPVIEKNQTKQTFEAMSVVMPDAKDFEKLEIKSDESGIAEAYRAKNSDGKEIGQCIVASQNGYGGEIKVLVGIDSDGRVTGAKIMSHSETPGLGANAPKPEFIDQFKGKTSGIKVEKSGGGQNSINAMSGATITSKAVTAAVNAALDFSERSISK